MQHSKVTTLRPSNKGQRMVIRYEYRVVTATRSEEFQEKVESWQSKGFECVGGVSTCYDPTVAVTDRIRYTQAMERRTHTSGK